MRASVLLLFILRTRSGFKVVGVNLRDALVFLSNLAEFCEHD